ncbi:MAG: hypothetical protein HYT65_03730 [Candidatus Yanofskybacteria bacterium]|nr:hypothetical protein [Candidatus Yanofskybacteria bacterium]
MMHHGNCKCFHHICAKVLVGLAWVAAVLFFWAGWKAGLVWGVSAEGYFRVIIVFVLLAFSTKFCGCCKKAMMAHGGSMSCPACEGKGGEHMHGNH